MAKFLILSVLALTVSLGNGFLIWKSPDDLRYPTRSMLETAMANTQAPIDLENLRYPTQPLLTTWIAEKANFFNQAVAMFQNLDFRSMLPPKFVSGLDSVQSLVVSTITSSLAAGISSSSTSSNTSDFDSDDFDSTDDTKSSVEITLPVFAPDDDDEDESTSTTSTTTTAASTTKDSIEEIESLSLTLDDMLEKILFTPSNESLNSTSEASRTTDDLLEESDSDTPTETNNYSEVKTISEAGDETSSVETTENTNQETTSKELEGFSNEIV